MPAPLGNNGFWNIMLSAAPSTPTPAIAHGKNAPLVAITIHQDFLSLIYGVLVQPTK